MARPSPRSRPHPLLVLLLVLGMSAGGPSVPSATSPLSAQTLPELTTTPEDAAELYLRSLRAIRWSAATQFMHPRTLARFRQVVDAIAEADTTGQVRRTLTDTDAPAYARLDDAEVFARSIGTMIDSMPGLMNAIYDRDDAVLGHVPESPDSAHVVYRTTARISGAESEVYVMQLTRTEDGWRVRWSDELQVLDTALRGFARPRRAPPPG